MNGPSTQVYREVLCTTKYGFSEQSALVLYGDPWRETRDGKGGHTYVWTGNGVALFATFHNGKCTSYQIMDEQDVKAMDFESP